MADPASIVPGGPHPVEQASGLMAAAGIDITHGEASATARIDVGEPVAAAALVGLLADVAGGLLALRIMAPLRVATSELSMHLYRGHLLGPVSATARVLRRRRNGLILTVDIDDEAGTQLGAATLHFAILGEARGPLPTDDDGEPVRHPATTIGTVVEFGELSQSGDGAELVVDIGDEQRNTFGALNGGLLTACMSRGASAAPGSRLGLAPVVVQLTQLFLAPARGPHLSVTARTVAQPTPDLAIVEVTMTDPDHGGREPARATALVARASGTKSSS